MARSKSLFSLQFQRGSLYGQDGMGGVSEQGWRVTFPLHAENRECKHRVSGERWELTAHPPYPSDALPLLPHTVGPQTS